MARCCRWQGSGKYTQIRKSVRVFRHACLEESGLGAIGTRRDLTSSRTHKWLELPPYPVQVGFVFAFIYIHLLVVPPLPLRRWGGYQSPGGCDDQSSRGVSAGANDIRASTDQVAESGPLARFHQEQTGAHYGAAGGACRTT